MKSVIAKVLLFLMLINGAVGLQTYAAPSDVRLYNRNEAIDLSRPIEDIGGKYYIAADDLYNLVVYMDCYKKGDTDVIEISGINYGSELQLYLGSNIVRFGSTSILFINPLLKLDDRLYVSVELIATAFSYTYDAIDGNIYLNIRNNTNRVVSGKVHLPEGMTAPEGGLPVNLFIGQISIDYNEPMDRFYGYENVTASIDPTVEPIPLFIPEGENSIPYSVSIENIYNVGVIYETPNDNYFNGYYSYEHTSPILSADGKIHEYYSTSLYNSDNLYIEIIPKKYISGRIYLPDGEIADEDIKYEIKMSYGRYLADPLYSGVIKKGENSAEYRLAVHDLLYSNLIVVLDNDKYANSVIALDENYSELEGKTEFVFDVFTQYVKTVNGMISLPEGLVLPEDITVEVALTKGYYEGYHPGYYEGNDINTVSVVIPAGEKSVNYKISDKMPTDPFSISYKCDYEDLGIFGYGFYGEDGVQLSYYSAADLSYDGKQQLDDINLTIVKSRLVTVNVSLPDDMTALEDLYFNIYPYKKTLRDEIYPMPLYEGVSRDMESDQHYIASLFSDNYYDGGYVLKGFEPAIKKGESKGSITKMVPAIDDYVLKGLSFNDDRFYHATFYNENSTTSMIENSTVLSSDIDEINIELLKQYKISGYMICEDYNPEDTRFFFRTYARLEDGTFSPVSNSIYNRIEEYKNDNKIFYSLPVPSDAREQVLAVYKTNYYYYNSSGERYYSKDGLTDDINAAEILSITDDIENINFNYLPYDPALPIKLGFMGDVSDVDFTPAMLEDNETYINLNNISDFDKENIKVIADFYNSDDELIRNVTSENYTISANSYDYFDITIPRLEKNITKFKLYAVDENGSIVSKIFEFNNDNSFGIIANGDRVKDYGKKPVILWMGTAIAPARMLSDIFGCSIEFIDETQTLIFKKDDISLVMQVGKTDYELNGVENKTDFVPEIFSGRAYVAIDTLADCFGYNFRFDEDNKIYEIQKP